MPQMPVFVKIPEDAVVRAIIDDLKQKLSEANVSLTKIKELSETEVVKINEWKSNFEEINKRTDKTKSMLLEPEGV